MNDEYDINELRTIIAALVRLHGTDDKVFLPKATFDELAPVLGLSFHQDECGILIQLHEGGM